MSKAINIKAHVPFDDMLNNAYLYEESFYLGEYITDESLSVICYSNDNENLIVPNYIVLQMNNISSTDNLEITSDYMPTPLFIPISDASYNIKSFFPIIKNDEEIIIPINVEVNPDATIVISSSLEGYLFTFCISRFLNYMQ